MRKFLGTPPLCTATGARLTLPPGPRRTPVALGGPVNPPDDAMNPTARAPGAVCDPGPAACGGGDPPGRRFVSRPDAAWVDALLAAVDAQV
ncbi:hypothetical protein BIV25_41615 [Streptomyces sp. MUSC 14]|uniref:hypothetical protein n=1 Tax=Streptomyces sp. MUSC 14 TaxID=1354889 RepID=UPI0008F559B4|nr:hypothetical protein [Streptomyces sp. MUSC 14]OIJ86268.1 hypothetical protein BIV25_41615 [Streptomyces sp. MUSC 14]